MKKGEIEELVDHMNVRLRNEYLIIYNKGVLFSKLI